MMQTKTILIVLAALGLIIASYWLLYPRGEEADWKRLQYTLGAPGPRTGSSPPDKFPIMNDLDGAEEQVDGIRVFVETYPQSKHIRTIIDDYLLPNLWLDAAEGGINATYGRRSLAELAIKYHAVIAPEEEKEFFKMVLDKLKKIPGSEEFRQKLMEDRKQEEMYALKEEFKNRKDIPDFFKNRMETITRLGYPGTHGKATPEFLEFLRKVEQQDAVIELQIKGTEPEKDVFSRIAYDIQYHLSREAGVSVSLTEYIKNKEQVKARLIIEVSPEVESIPVTVTYTPTSTTYTSKKLSREWDNGLQRWAYTYVDSTEVKTESARSEGAEYPMLKAELLFETVDGGVSRRENITSGRQFERFQGKILVSEIGEGSEVVDGTYAYSAQNLAFRAIHTLIGEAMDFE